MWDQPPLNRSNNRPSRIIPTYVGSTQHTDPGRNEIPNHSHVCGINSLLLISSYLLFESFPRMWDQQPSRLSNLSDTRIIPTYVGSTAEALPSYAEEPNHSHVCGINLVSDSVAVSRSESFPRMWDQRRRRSPKIKWDRIIPTYVGSTIAYMSRTSSQSNHSHVCGINVEGLSDLVRGGESFPRMWDQPNARLHRDGEERIIPTYVGSTDRTEYTRRAEANHSHVCGINFCDVKFWYGINESFPRMWDQPYK